jgi:hypothetical protein
MREDNSRENILERDGNKYSISRMGFGFGYEFSINKFFIDIDISAGILKLSEVNRIRINWDVDEDHNFSTQIYQLRLTAGYKIFEHLGVFGGVSYDYFYKRNNSFDPRDFREPMIGDAFGPHIHKLGFFGGIQF